MTTPVQQMQDNTSTDRIEKRMDVRAPRSRVWRAVSNAEEFGTWFRAVLDGTFVEGETIRGRVTIPGYEHVKLEIVVERMEPERYFSYRWHPYAIDPSRDYSDEPMTLVEFILDETADGTAITIIESGFDRIPLARRAEAYRSNDGGWAGQIKNIARHVS